jgi:hypothetical protein
MREPHHKPLVEVGEAQEVVKLSHFLQGQPIVDELDLGWIHMYTLKEHLSSFMMYPKYWILCICEGTLLQIGI